MLSKALKFLSKEINTYLNNRFGAPDDGNRLLLSGIVNPDGSMAVEEKDKIILSLIAIEHDNYKRNFVTKATSGGNGAIAKNPAVNLNLYLLFSAYFKPGNYADALTYLSGVISFFQGKFVFTNQNSPALEEIGIEKLIIETVSLNFQEMNQLWGAIGSKYMPSTVYKMKMITVEDGVIQQVIPVVQGVQPEAVGQ